jgi:hypothetical protein
MFALLVPAAAAAPIHVHVRPRSLELTSPVHAVAAMASFGGRLFAARDFAVASPYRLRRPAAGVSSAAGLCGWTGMATTLFRPLLFA